MKPLSECRLYTFVDTAYLRDRSPQSVTQSLCDGGSDLIQLRDKGSPMETIRDMAEAILPITRRAGVYLVINDHPQLAVEAGAPLCHLGQEDFFDAGYRHISELRTHSPQLRVGLSTHNPAQAERAIAAGADYVAVGPVYATGTKPTAKPVTLDYVTWAAANVKIPWFAIGGINLENLEAVLSAGARRIGVVSAILNAADITAACQNFKNRLLSAPF
jgi:thiamine-phosphate pyrophosphorylase